MIWVRFPLGLQYKKTAMLNFISLSKDKVEHLKFKELYKNYLIKGDLKLGYSLFKVINEYKEWMQSTTNIIELKNTVDKILLYDKN